MPKMLPITYNIMTHSRWFRLSLGVVLNGADLLVAAFLAIGGWNATNSHPITGYICMALAPVLLYLSSGVWTGQKFKLIIRLVFYFGASGVIGLSAVLLTAFQGFHPLFDAGVVFGLVALFFLVALFSALQLRLTRGTAQG